MYKLIILIILVTSCKTNDILSKEDFIKYYEFSEDRQTEIIMYTEEDYK